MSYPIIVERMEGDRALRIICLACKAQGQITPDDLNQDAMWPCPAGCGADATFKYVEADHKCPNCGRLGFFPHAVAPACSRPCKLQAEYAETLKGAA